MEKQGDCFRWALWDAVRNGGNLVHGWVQHIIGTELIAHAWTERDGLVYDWQSCEYSEVGPTPLDKFYQQRKPTGLAVYPGTPKLVGRAHRKGHYGPWHRPPWSDSNWRPNPIMQRICEACGEIKPHYAYKLCYLCYRKNQCRWLDDIDRWVDSLEKPQCQRLMHRMGFCKKHWKHIQQLEQQRRKRDQTQ